jgi:hypothetical protein
MRKEGLILRRDAAARLMSHPGPRVVTSAWRALRLWSLGLFAIVPALSLEVAAPRFEPLGQFSNMHYSQDHQSGQDVYLWRELNELHGYMEYSLGGALGDFTTARLENVRFDPANKSLSFHARNPLYEIVRDLTVDRPDSRLDVFVGQLPFRVIHHGNQHR